MLSTQLKKKKEFLTVSHVKFFSVYGNQGFSIDSMSTKEIERHFYIFFCLYVSLYCYLTFKTVIPVLKALKETVEVHSFLMIMWSID